MTRDQKALIAFTRTRLAEDHERACGLLTATRIPGKVPDFTAAGGPLAEDYWAHFTPQREIREIARASKLVDRYERLLKEMERHNAAVVELQADVDHKTRTGQCADSRSHALLREGDYLTAMIPIVRELVAAKAAIWNDHQDYLKEEWAP